MSEHTQSKTEDYYKGQALNMRGYKIRYRSAEYDAISVTPIRKRMPNPNQCVYTPTFLEVTAINKDGLFVVFNDETWMFTFYESEAGSHA